MEKNKCNNCSTDNPITNKYCSHCGYELPKIQTVIKDEPVKYQTTKKNVVLEVLQKSTKKRKLSVKGMIGIAVMIITLNLVQQYRMKSAYNNAMMDVANEINKSCPFMVDSETRIDSSVSLPENVFQYCYTLINVVKESIDTVELRNILEPKIINFVKTSPKMKIQRDHKTTIDYSYFDKSRKHLFTISVTPDKYE